MDHIQDRMTEGSIAGKLVRFAVPLFIGNLFQQLYNTADALIVGNMLGNDALAAVSSTGTLVFLLVSFFAGISAGAGVAISRYYGAREHDKMELAIHTNIAFNIVAGILLTIVGVRFTPTILRWMSTPEDVFEQAALYVRIYFAGSLGLVMYNSCRGIMQAVGDSKHPLYYLIISSVLNVILDIVFIGVFKTDVDGAALATILAQFISFFLCAGRLLTTKEEYRVSIKKIGFNWPMLRLIVNYGLPSGLQNSVIAIANVVVQANINSFGKMATAAYGAYSKIEGFAFLPVTSFSMAATTFVGQNYGAGNLKRVKKGTWVTLAMGVLYTLCTGTLLLAFQNPIMHLFTSDETVVSFGCIAMHYFCPFYFLLSILHGMAGAVRGTGRSVPPMVVLLVSLCLFRVVWIQFVLPFFSGIEGVFVLYPVSWALGAVLMVLYAWKGSWMTYDHS